MPTIVQTTLGKVTGLWGSAVLLMGNGKAVALKIGDLVHKGDVVLTTQDGIVQLTDAQGTTVEVIADTKPRQTTDGAGGDIDRVIADLNTGANDSAPAAGLVGGDGAGLTPGYRVDRIAEGVGPNGYTQGAAAVRTELSQYVASQSASTSDATAPAVPRDPATTVTLTPSTPSVSEGGSVIITATVGAPVTGSPLVIGLSNGQTIVIPVGQTSGTSAPYEPRVDDAQAQGPQTVDVSIVVHTGGNYQAVNPTGPASIQTTDDADTTTVTLTASAATVAEGGSLIYTASVDNPVAGSPLVVTLSNGATITIPVGQSSGTVTWTAPDDAHLQGTRTQTVAISGASGGNYEDLDTTRTVTTSLTDDADQTTITISASTPSVVEGGSVVYTATVNGVVQGAPLVITLSNGQNITIPVGQSSASSTPWAVRADDAYAQGTQTLNVGVAGTSGGDFEALNSTSVVTQVTDDNDATTATLSASSANVAEGGSIVYTVTLSNPVGGSTPMTITLSNGQTITIPVGASSGNSNPFTVRADDAYAQANDTHTVSIDATSGGNFEDVTRGPAVSTTVTDDGDATTVTLTASSANVTEGGSITYTATVSNPVTGSALVITLNNGETITIPVGASSASSNAVAVRADDAYVQPNGTVTASINGTTGGNYESLTTTSTTTTTVVDDSDSTTVTLSASAASVAEGGSIVYTASVNNAVTGSPLVVTLSNGETITIPVGASSATSNAVAVRADDAYTQADDTVTVSIGGTTGGNFEHVATGPAVSTTVTDDGDAITLTLNASSANVTEGGSITYTATLSNAVTGSPLTITLSNGQTITIPVGQSSGASTPFAVRGDDAYSQADDTHTVSVLGTSGGNFEAITASGPVTTIVTDDNDGSVVTLTASSASVAEGGSITYTASVNNAVTGTPLVITLNNGQTITIPVGASSASSNAVAVRADDAYVQGNATVTASISSTTGGNYESLAITSTASTTVTDDSDATTVTLTASSANVAEGGSIVYTATLSNPVGGSTPMTVTLSNGQTITIPVGASSGSSNPFIVRADDAYAQANDTHTVSIDATSGGNFEDVTRGPAVTTTVTDDGDASVVTLTASATTVAEGGSITYTATVSNPVTGSALVITLNNGEIITIPVGASSASSNAVAVRADDAYVQPNGTVTASISGTTGGNYESLTTTSTTTTTVVDDADSTTVTLTASATSIVEGGSITYTATVNNVVTGSPLVVTLSNGETITIPVGASSASSNAVAVRADDAYAQADDTVTASISNVSGGNYEDIARGPAVSTTVTDDNDATTVTLTASSANVTEGGSIVYTATLSNVVTGSPLVITLSNTQTITIPVGQSSGTSAPFAVRADDAQAQGDQTLNVTVNGSTGGNFESVTATGSATTIVSDNPTGSAITLSASAGTVTEGGSVVFTAVVDHPVAGSPLSITLSNGQVITIPVGQSSASSAPYDVREDDLLVQGTQTLPVSIVTTGGGNFESLATTSHVSIDVVDDNDVVTVSLSASPSVDEGGMIIYAAVLTALADSPITVTLSNGQSITIPTGAAWGFILVPAASDDVYLDSSSVSAHIVGVTGGHFENLQYDAAPATTVIDDTIDNTTLSITGSPTVAEGASASYTLSLTRPAQTAVTVTLSYSGTAADGSDFTGVTTVTIPAGSSSAGFSIATLDDALAEGAENFTVTIGGTNGGNFENLVVSTSHGSVTTGIVDNDIATVSLTATGSLTEAGGSIVYTATITQAPTTALTITLSNGATIGIAAGALSGTVSVPVAASDDVYRDPTTVSANISSTSGGGIPLSVDTTPATTSIVDTLDDTTVTLTSSAASVAEGGAVVYTATVDHPVTGSALVLNLSNGQTITIPVGQSSASSTPSVLRADDAYTQGTQTVTVSVDSHSGGNFEAVVATSTTSTTVSDDVDTSTVTLSASTASVAEGGSITYTATVNQPVTGSDLVLHLSNSQTITIPVGQSSASSAPFAVRGDDAYVQGTQTLNVTIDSTSGGNYEDLATAGTATTTVTDDSDNTSVTLSASSASVVEGGSIVYTATVSNPVTGSPLVVHLDNGQDITIPVGQSSASSTPWAVRADDAHSQGDTTVSAAITGTDGGNFEHVSTGPAVSTTVTDDSDATSVTLSASSSTVTEGGSIVYTATLSNPVGGSTPMTITLSNGQTITIAVGASSGSSTPYTVRADDAYSQADDTHTVSIGSTSGGNFEAVSRGPAVTTTVTDDGDASVVTLTASATTVAEGGSITYTATVSNAVTGSPLVITLNNGETITIPVGASSANSNAVAVRADDAYVQPNGTVTASINGTTGGNYESLTTTSTTTTTVVDDSDATTVTLTASSANVAEGGSIVYTATLSNAVTGSPLVITLSNTQTITIPVGQSSGTSAAFTVRADDAYVQADDTLTVSVSGTTGGNFEALSPTGSATTVVQDDADASVVTLSASATSVNEGGSITYTATVSNPVTGSPLVITLNNGEQITIPVGQSSGSSGAVLVRADDAYVQPNGTVTASINGTTGGNFESLATTSTATTTVTDDGDATTVTLSASATTVAEGGSITYTATVNNAVTGSDLVVHLSNGQTITIPVGASSASSTPWAVRADDAYAQGDQAVSTTIDSTTGGNFEAVTHGPAVSTTVTDDADATTVTLTASASTVAEGGSITYTATVNNAVTGSPLVITLNNGQQITIPVGQSSASSAAVAVRADDAQAQGPETVTASINGTSGGNFESLTTNSTASTTVTDDGDVSTVTLSASNATVTEGGSIVYTATVSNAVAGSALVITLNNGETITIPVGQTSASSAAVLVRADDAYAQGSQTVTASINGTTGGSFESLNTASTASTTVTDDADVTTVTLTASSAAVTEGGSIVYTASVNNAVTGSPLVITLNNGQVITIPVGQSSASSGAVAVRADDAYVQGSTTVTASINGATGGNFEALNTASTASTTVSDDADSTTVTLSASATSVTEGGSITYTATVSNPVTGSALVVTLSNGETITIPVGASSASSNAVAVRGDDAYIQGNATVTAAINGTTGGNFEHVATGPAVSTTVTDDSDATVVTLTASASSVNEGGSIVYTATVNNAVTGSPLVITLNNGQQITIPVGSSSGNSAAVAVRGDDAYVQGNGTVTASINGATGGNFESLTTTSTATTTVTDDSDSTLVTLTASSGSVAEGGSITYTATVSNPVTGSALVVTLSNGQAITIPVGASSASSNAVAVRGDDAYAQGNATVTVSIDNTTGGNYEAVARGPAVSTTVTDDADATTVTLTASSANVTEGGSITYTATLSNPVGGSSPMTITLSNGQTISIPVGQSSGTSAAWVVRADDAYVQANQVLNVTVGTTSGGNFEAVTPTGTATTTVVDDVDSTVVTLTASSTTIVEGGSITYTATVSNAVTGSPLVITLNNGQQITIPVGSSSGSSNAVAVRGDDAYVQGNATVTASINGATGGNFESLTTTSTASTTVTDDSDATTVTLTASSASVAEGGSITYTATVNNVVTGTALVITLSNGETITIPVGQSSASSAAVPVRADDAYAQGNQTVTASISNTSGGNYEAVTRGPAVSTTVTDDGDATTVTLTPSSTTVTEGGSITYTATLSNAVTGSPLVITLSNSQTITIPVGQSSGTSAAFAVRADDAYVQGTQTLNVTVSTTSGGNFEAVTPTGTATTTVTDDADSTVVTLTASSASVSEGGTITYTATVNNVVAGSPLVITLNNGQQITIPVGSSSGSSNAVAVRADDAYAQGNQTVTASINGTSGGNFEALTTTSTASTTVTDDGDASTVTLSASSASVVEGGSITYTATVSNAVTGAPLVINLSNGQSITIPVGQTSGTSAAFAVRGDDVYTQGNQVLTVGINNTTGGNYESLTTTSTTSTTVTDDSDATTVTLSASATSIAEGGSIVYTATVNNAVAGSPLVVTLSNGQTITIPVGQSSASSAAVAVRADDAYVQGNQTVTASISTTSGGNFEAITRGPAVSTTVTDDSDATTVTLTASSSTVAEGGSIVYTATLSNAVTGSPLVITLSNNQTITIPVGQSSGTSAAFAVRADDAYVQGTQTLNVTVGSTSGGNFEAVTPTGTATTTVTDDSDATVVTLTPSSTTIVEGGSITYTATVNNAVTGSPLVITLSNGQQITIPVGQSSGTSAAVAVRGDDAYVQGNATVTASINGTTGGNYESLTTTSTASTTVTDDSDATTVTLSASSASVVEGGSIVYTATVNNVVTGSPLVVTLSNGQIITIPVGSSSASSAAVAVRADDAYAQGNQTVSASIDSTSGGNYEAVARGPAVSTTVTDDNDATTVTLTASASNVTEGGSITYTATVNNVVTGSPLVIQLSNTQSITIPVGASSASSTAFAVRADDAYAQGTQTVTTSISGTSGGNYESLTTTSTATTTVNDDSDPTTVTLSVSSPTVVEGGSVTYTATLSNAVTGTPLVINLSNGQSITIPVGASSGTSAGHVVRADDAYAQGSQAVSVGVTSTSGGTYEALTTTSTASTTVSDDTDTTTVSLSGATSVTEGGNAVYTLTLSSPAATAVTVTLTYGGTAANGTDYTAVTTVTIPAGASSANFTVPTTNDTLNEASETIAISIGGVSGGGFEAIAAHPSNNAVTTTINDNDPLPTIAINDVVVNEAAGTATFTVTLSAASGQQVTVGYGTSNGSATAGSDYTAASGTLTFSPGVTSQTITVNILDDGTYEGVENFNVNLSTPTNATISDNLGVGTIRDDGTGTGGTDNDTPTLAVSSPTVAEGGGYAVFTLSLSNAATSATTVSLATVAGTATAGTDYSTTLQVSTDGGANWTNATSATFAAGATSVLVRSAITNDTLDEPNESFSLTATTTAGATTNASATGNATITDDDPTPTLAINDVSVNEGAGTMTFTVTLSTASGQQVTVNYGTSNGSATAGSDYTAASGTLTFSPGVTSQTITVSILNDTTTESTETFNVNLSGATNATIADNLGVGSIVDNDARPVIDLDANNSNAGGVDYTATFTENGSPVSIADTDISITDVDSTALTGATITLTNAQAGDVLAAGTLPSGITASLVGNVITLSGSATLAAYQTAIRAITFSSTSETPSTADRIITVTVTDGSNASAAATTYMHVVAVNDAPVATGGSVTGTEDTALVLSWATFGVTDVDSATTSLGIKIATLPADGTLQTWNGSAWTNVSSGQTITKATIDSGFFRLVPDANESGSDAYAGTAVGNRQSDYARFNFTPTDGSADGAVATVRIDITPVTDTAALTHNASSQVTGTLSPMTSIGLTRDYYEDVPTLTSGASSSAPATGETGIETAVPTSSSTITNVGVSGTNVGDGGVQVAEDDAYRVQGLIYLEAGKSYTFSGYADDTSRLEIGGTTVMSGQWGGSGQASDGTFTATTFTPTATGYYSLEFMVYNTSGPGSYDLNLSVNGAAAVDVSTANFYLYQSITQVDTAGAQRGAFVANTTTGEGGYYPVRYDSGVQSKVYLAPIVATLTDTDGSETLAVQLQNIPVGTIISDGTRSFTATASATSVVVTAWDLSRLSVTAPSGFSGTVTLTAVATATETATGTSTVTSLNIPITIDLNGALAQQAEANTYNADALIGLAGADIFNVSESGNGLSVAVTQGASGSIQALTGTETTATTNQVFSTGGGNDLVQSGAGDDTIYLGDSGNSNHPTTGAAPTAADIAATRLMTLADSSVVGSNGQLTSTADNTSSSSNTAINTWADVANAGSGNDVVYGQNGTDLIYGGSGNDYLNGGAGNDGLRGGAGNDILVGGAGNDVLRGDAGADVFRWEFGDKGTAGTPAADIIMDFDTATPGNGGDVLDLRDLLQGETSGNLSNYLHFSVSGGNTTIQISSSGAFSTGFATNKIDQTITLQNVDLTSSGALTTDQQIIQDLVNKSKLLVDGS